MKITNENSNYLLILHILNYLLQKERTPDTAAMRQGSFSAPAIIKQNRMTFYPFSLSPASFTIFWPLHLRLLTTCTRSTFII